MIYTFNARGFVLYPVLKSYFELSDKDVYNTIRNGFDILQKQLDLKKISYDALKGALIPNQDKDKFETCFVFDSTQIDSFDYGYQVFEKFIPLLDKESTYSILAGDYIDIFKKQDNSQIMLNQALNDVLERYHGSVYHYSNQYYLIYINRLTRNQRQKIIEGLNTYPWFTGFADLTHSSLFKTLISNTLTHVCIKNKKRIIVPHPIDYPDEDNINMRGFPFEENGFILSSINDENYGAFLSYKIESEVPDKDDVSFSFNALFPKFDSFEKIILNISNDRWDKYLTDKDKGKGHIIEVLGYNAKDKERFVKEIFKQVSANYIYNLEENQYGDFLFNVCIELPTVNGTYRKTTIALKYYPNSGEMDVVTIT